MVRSISGGGNEAVVRLRFCTETGVLGSGIRFVTHAPRTAPSHVEFELADGTFLGAHSSGGVAIRPANYCTPSWERRYALPCTTAQRDAVLGFAHAQVGKGYDLRDIAGILLDEGWHTAEAWICSELVVAALLQAGLPFLNVLPGYTYRIDPDKAHLSPLLLGRCYLHAENGVTLG